ncbi:MAG: 2-oxoglutarate dehydrogenase, partial [Deltaproteobacteria bacterium]|nr:2-oxoglutarate dehydrogenase [Deltaproteobacteria bacterium]
MADKIVMPQLGESIAEGTIVKWLKKPGDAIKKDENILVISTDKVEAEIPAPASGTLLSADVPEGTTVAVGTVLGYVGAAGETPA